MNTAKEIAGILGLELFTSVYWPKGVLYVFDDCACALRHEEEIHTAWKYAGGFKVAFDMYSKPPTIPAGVKILPPVEPGTFVEAEPSADFDTMLAKSLRDNPALRRNLGMPEPAEDAGARQNAVFLPGDGLIGGRPAGIESEAARQLRAMPRCYVCDKPGATPRLKERGTPLCDGCHDNDKTPADGGAR